jgi:hypothetical protein
MTISTETARHPSGAAKMDLKFWWLVAAGAVSVIVSLLIGTTKYTNTTRPGHWTLSQVNGICSSSLGQFAQAMDARAGAKCASIATLEQWRGWLMAAGVAAIAAGIAWGVAANRSR